MLVGPNYIQNFIHILYTSNKHSCIQCTVIVHIKLLPIKTDVENTVTRISEIADSSV